MSPSPLVQIQREPFLAVVTLHRPEKLNALNPEMLEALRVTFEELKSDPDVRVVILTGAGDRAFVAGADISVLAQMTPLSALEMARSGQDVLRLIETFPRPVIAAVGGFALGGGCELALACHLRVASENARFGLPEVGLGILPGYGGTVRLARLIGLGKALELTLTGTQIDAHEAERLGLVNSVVPRDALLERARELAGRILRNGPLAVERALASVYHALEAGTDEALAYEAASFGLLAASADMKEGLSAFLEKRKPTFRGQ